MSFWDVLWLWFGVALAAHLFVVVALVVDVLRDPAAPARVRAGWILSFVFLPVIAEIAYLVVRGRDAGERRQPPARPVRRPASLLDERAVGGVQEPVRGRPRRAVSE